MLILDIRFWALWTLEPPELKKGLGPSGAGRRLHRQNGAAALGNHAVGAACVPRSDWFYRMAKGDESVQEMSVAEGQMQ